MMTSGYAVELFDEPTGIQLAATCTPVLVEACKLSRRHFKTMKFHGAFASNTANFLGGKE